jgi:hypothetical protein
VANHLNDIYRAHPALVCDVAQRGLQDSTDDRQALVAHALRTAVKKGDARALKLLGFGQKPQVDIQDISFAPKTVRIGGKTRLALTLVSNAKRPQTLSVDLVVHFVKSNGEPSKSMSLAVHTTRKPYPGKHQVELMLNGERRPLGAFVVKP